MRDASWQVRKLQSQQTLATNHNSLWPDDLCRMVLVRVKEKLIRPRRHKRKEEAVAKEQRKMVWRRVLVVGRKRIWSAKKIAGLKVLAGAAPTKFLLDASKLQVQHFFFRK